MLTSSFTIQNLQNNNNKGLLIENTLEPKVICRVFHFDPNRVINDDAKCLMHYQYTGLDFEILEPVKNGSEPDENVINVVHEMNFWVEEQISIGAITL